MERVDDYKKVKGEFEDLMELFHILMVGAVTLENAFIRFEKPHAGKR